MSAEFDTDQCMCRLNLVDGRMSVYRSINQFVSQICVSVEFDSEGVEFGRQRIGVEYYLVSDCRYGVVNYPDLCETYL